MQKEKLNSLFVDKIVQLLDKTGVDTSNARRTKDNLMIRCPFAPISGHRNSFDRLPSMGLRLHSGGFQYNCFTCHRKGNDIFQFFEQLKSNKLIKNFNIYELQASLITELPDYEQVFSSVETHRNINLSKWKELTARCIAYNKEKRGLTDRSIKVAQLHYNKETKQVVFPCYDKNVVLKGYVEHYINGRQPKYKNEVDRANILYFEWMIKGSIGIVVEGIYDTIKIHQYLYELKLLHKYSVVGIFGAEIAEAQIKLLARYFNSLVLMGDNDEAGQHLEKTVYYKLRDKIPLIYRVDYKGKDPDSISLSHFNSRLKKMQLYGNNLLYVT